MSVILKRGETVNLRTGQVEKAPIDYKHPKRKA